MSIKENTLTGEPETTDEYEAMIQVLDTLISEGLRKFVGDGRLRDMEKEEKRLEYMKRTEQVIRAKREVVKDKQLQEMGRTLEALQETNDLDLDLSN
jgi:CHASE3 domain sensor protein